MGGVEVLHPQDLFKHNNHHHNRLHHHHLISPAMRSLSHPHPLPPPTIRFPNRRKRSPPKKTTTFPPESNRHYLRNSSSKPTTSNTMGTVKILKRGEALPVSPVLASSVIDLTLMEKKKQQPSPPPPVRKAPKNNANTANKKKSKAGARVSAVLGRSETELKQTRRMSDFFAGSACITSPPPSSLPVPAFLGRKFSS